MRDNLKKRPNLPNEILKGVSSVEEDFQNKVVRPIVKMQSDLLIAHLHHQLKSSKILLDQLDLIKKEAALTYLFTKNQAFKREINGMVIGHFTLEEYNKYLDFSKEINRRITLIVLNRCSDLILNR